jgi:hypothetical protein
MRSEKPWVCCPALQKQTKTTKHLFILSQREMIFPTALFTVWIELPGFLWILLLTHAFTMIRSIIFLDGYYPLYLESCRNHETVSLLPLFLEP